MGKKMGGKAIRSPITKVGGAGIVTGALIGIAGKLEQRTKRRDPEAYVDMATKRGYITKGKGLGETTKSPFGGYSREQAHKTAAELIYGYNEKGLPKTKDKPYVEKTYQKDKPTVDRNQVVGKTRPKETTYNQDMPDTQLKITGQDAFKITQGKKIKGKRRDSYLVE